MIGAPEPTGYRKNSDALIAVVKSRTLMRFAASMWGSLCLFSGCAQTAGFPGQVSNAISSGPGQVAVPGHRSGQSLSGKVSWSAPSQVRLPFRWRGGVPNVRATINGREVWMVPDTGSQTTLLERDTALRCALRMVAEGARLEGIQGVEDAAVGVPEELAIGDWKWHHLPCLVQSHRSPTAGAPLGPQLNSNLLGLDAMKQMCAYVTFDFLRSEVVFGFHEPYAVKAGEVEIPLHFERGLPFVQLSFGVQGEAALLDTGASAAAELNLEAAQRIDLAGATDGRGISRAGFGAMRDQRTFRQVRVAGSRLSGLELPPFDVLLVPDLTKVGIGLLRHYRCTVDFTRSKVWLGS